MSTQTALLVTPADYEALRSERDELRLQVADEIAAGERQAQINLELMRLLEQVCPACRAIVTEAIQEEIETTRGD